MTTFGQTIREARVELGFSLRELADELGIDCRRLFDYEHDNRVPSTLERVAQIADALELDFDLLRARAGWLADEEISFLKANPKLLVLIGAMMAAGYGEAETERLIKEVKKRKKSR